MSDWQGANYPKRTLYKAVCADCGLEIQLPFKPEEGRPVYCRRCYSKREWNKRKTP